MPVFLFGEWWVNSDMFIVDIKKAYYFRPDQLVIIK